MDRKKIKEQAKEAIKGRLWQYIAPSLLISLLVGLAVFVPSFIFGDESAITSIVEIAVELAVVPASMGLISYYMKLTRREEVNMNELTRWYGLFGSILVLNILISIFVTLWSLLLIIPGIIAAISYSMAMYIFVDGNHNASSCIKESKELMNGYKSDYFVFILSFIGWQLLAILTFGLLYIWLAPYMTAANIIYYDELKKVKGVN